LFLENKKKVLKEENAAFKAELERFSKRDDELFKKVNESELANAVYNLKIEELKKKIGDLEKKNDELEAKVKELLRQNEDLINQLKKKESYVFKKEEVDHIKEDEEIKLKNLTKEHKNEISILQSTVNKLISEKGTLELELLKLKRKSISIEAQISKITVPVKIDQKSNIFGAILKKAPETNKFLKDAQKQYKETEDKLNIIMKDKIEDLKKLRENIISMSPKTVSTRSAPDNDYENIDFDNDEEFKKLQETLLQREEKHQEEKQRKSEEKQRKSNLNEKKK